MNNSCFLASVLAVAALGVGGLGALSKAPPSCDFAKLDWTLNVESAKNHAIVVDDTGSYRGGKAELTPMEAVCVKDLKKHPSLARRRMAHVEESEALPYGVASMAISII